MVGRNHLKEDMLQVLDSWISNSLSNESVYFKFQEYSFENSQEADTIDQLKEYNFLSKYL